MKILEVSSSGTIGTTEMGPISNVVCSLSGQFAMLGNEVTIIDNKTDLNRTMLPEKVRLVDIDFPSTTTLKQSHGGGIKGYAHGWIDDFRYASRVNDRVKLDSFDIIHTHSPRLTYILQRFFKKQCAYTSHTPQWCLSRQNNRDPKRSSNTPSVRHYLSKQTEISAIRASRVTIAFGHYLVDCVPNANIVLIPSGLDANTWTPSERQAARQALGLNSKDFIIVFVGRVAPVKGVNILLEALEQLETLHDRIQVLIIGSLSGSYNGRDTVSSYAQTMQEKAHGLPVTFKGFINNKSPEFRQYLSAADVSVVPSLSEPQGLVVLEALAMEKPVVASNTGGIPLMVNEEVGQLFEPGDSTALAESLQRLYEQPELLCRMQKNARNHVLTKFAWSNVAQKYIDAFSH